MFATLEASALGPDIRVASVRGSEAICRPYEFHIYFALSSGDAVDVAAAISSPAKLILKSGEATHDVCGILVCIQLMVQTESWALYEATLVPKLWHLGLTKHSRVFTKMSVPDIIKDVLEGAGFTSQDYEMRLSGSYEPEELIVQYRESKLKFIQRWMEHEGIYYFFEHAEGADKMIIVDDTAAHVTLSPEPVRYRPLMDHDTSAGACFDEFRARYSTTVKSVKLSDYDYGRPLLDLAAEEDVSDRGFGEMYIHRARFWEPGQGKRYAKIRAEELKAQEVVFHAGGSALNMGAGYLFDLSEHTDDSYNKTYLATEVVHFCNQVKAAGGESLEKALKPEFEEVYRVQVTAIDHELQYRAPRNTRRPRIWGYENGVVDGEADSPYAQIDDTGRYLVKFKFDESDLKNGKASTYVRMMQPHGGTTEGFHFPLRKGTEVIFTFQGGDPDRPVIAGVVPNTTTPSPVKDANSTQNVIRTGSNNYFILDDKEGEEFIAMRTPKDNTGFYFGNPIGADCESFDGSGHNWSTPDANSIVLHTDGHTKFTIGGNWTINCSKIVEHAKGTVTETYDGKHTTDVTTGGRKETISGLQEEEYKNSHKITVTGKRDDTVTGKVTDHYFEHTKNVDGWINVTGMGATHHVDNWFNAVGDVGAKLEGGASAWVIGDNTLIKGKTSIKLDAPKIEITTPINDWVKPKETVLGAIFDATWAKKFEIVGFASGVTGLKVEGTLVKAETFGLAFAAKGVSKESKGVDLNEESISLNLDGLKTIWAGLTTFG